MVSYERNIIESILPALAIGFEPTSRSTLSAKLERIRPNGGTAMRDSLA
jgi:hypothetical protein